MATAIINVHNFVVNDVFRDARKYATYGNHRTPRLEAKLPGVNIKRAPLLDRGSSVILNVGRFRLLITENCLTKDRTEFKEITKKHIIMLSEISRDFPDISEEAVRQMEDGFNMLHNNVKAY